MKNAPTFKPWMPALLVGAVCVIAGVLQGDYADTLAKAIRICLECIGIG